MEFVTKEELKKHALACLREYTTAVFSTVSPEGKPHAATMYFNVDDDFNFYFLSLRDTRKVRNLETNKNVAIVVGFGPEKITIQVGGTAEITDTIEPDVFWSVIEGNPKFRDDEELPIALLARSGTHQEEFVVIRVKPAWLSCLNYDYEGHPDSYYHDFQGATTPVPA